MFSKIGRIAAITAALATLAGCWFSKADMFTPNEFAIVPLDGAYASEIDYEDKENVQQVRFTREDDGRYRMDIDVAHLEEPHGEISSIKRETMQLAFIAIPNAPDGWYLMHGIEDTAAPERAYLLANVNQRGVLELYIPNCRGTPERPGMTIAQEAAAKVGRCDFTDKQALLSAAKEAADFLDQDQIALTTPFMAFTPKDN